MSPRISTASNPNSIKLGIPLDVCSHLEFSVVGSAYVLSADSLHPPIARVTIIKLSANSNLVFNFTIPKTNLRRGQGYLTMRYEQPPA